MNQEPQEGTFPAGTPHPGFKQAALDPENPESGSFFPAITRRQALLMGALGALAWPLRTNPVGAQPVQPQVEAAGHSFSALSAEEGQLIAKLARVLLAPYLSVVPSQQIQVGLNTAAQVDRLVSTLSPAVQAELHQVFELLGLAPTRLLLTGLWRDWDRVSLPEAVGALENLAYSTLSLKRRMYKGLNQLIAAAFFGSEAGWAVVGYPGPPQVFRPERPWRLP